MNEHTQVRMLFVPGAIGPRQNCYDRVEPMAKHPANPVMAPEHPWETSGVHWPSVLYSPQENLFKMWYMVSVPDSEATVGEGPLIDNVQVRRRHAICYACSEDGIRWRRPSLGKLLEKQYPGNNIVLMDSGLLLGTTTVIEDADDADPTRRYKLLMYDYDGKGSDGARTAVSADGIDWNFVGEFPMLPSQDTPTLWHDRRRGQYVAFLKTRLDGRRARMISVSRDFATWSEPAMLLAPDAGDSPTLQFYGQTAFHHCGHDLGFLNRFEFASQKADMELIVAPQGVDWRRLPGRPTILQPADTEQSWDCGAIYPGLNEPIVRPDDTYWFYYCGSKSRHDEHLADPGAIGIATFTKGRLIGQQFEGEGWFVCMPFFCPGGELTLDAVARKPITVEVCGVGYSNTTPCEGYARQECRAVEGDSAEHVVSWNGKRDLEEFRGKYITLRVSGCDSIVYGAGFRGPRIRRT